MNHFLNQLDNAHGLDATTHFSSNNFSSAFCSFCFHTAALVIIIMAFSGSPTPEFC